VLSAVVVLILTEIGSTISSLFGGSRKTDETAENKESSEEQKDEVGITSVFSYSPSVHVKRISVY
jgi:hypothetical protein